MFIGFKCKYKIPKNVMYFKYHIDKTLNFKKCQNEDH